MFTDEQLKALMASPDIAQAEDEMKLQQAQAAMLRNMGQNQRMDWASQTARGIGGIGAAMQDYRAAKGLEGMAGKRDILSKRIAAGMGLEGQPKTATISPVPAVQKRPLIEGTEEA